MLTEKQLEEIECRANVLRPLRITEDIDILVVEVRRQRDALARVRCANGDTAWLERWIEETAHKETGLP